MFNLYKHIYLAAFDVVAVVNSCSGEELMNFQLNFKFKTISVCLNGEFRVVRSQTIEFIVSLSLKPDRIRKVNFLRSRNTRNSKWCANM